MMKKTITFNSRITGPDFKVVNDKLGIAALDAKWTIVVSVSPNADYETIANIVGMTSLEEYPD